MKKILPALGIIAVFAACNTKQSAAEQELAIMKAKQATVDSMNIVAEQKAFADQKTVSYASAVKRTSAAKRSSARTSQYASYSEPAVLPTATPAPVEKKKGWSNKAKGAVIGGVVGAGAGAIISKEKKAQGAIIGAVLGAGAGYGVGAILDKKAGR